MINYYQMIQSDTYANLPSSAFKGQFAFVVSDNVFYTADGNGNWTPSSRTIVKKSAVTINAKNTGATKVYTLEGSPFSFYPAMVIPRVVSIAGVTTPPTFSVGTNSTSYNNILQGSLLSTLMATLGIAGGVPQNVSMSPALSANTDIYANVTIGAIATTYSVAFDILGYYQ